MKKKKTAVEPGELVRFANALRDFLGLDPIPEVGRVRGVRTPKRRREDAGFSRSLPGYGARPRHYPAARR